MLIAYLETDDCATSARSLATQDRLNLENYAVTREFGLDETTNVQRCARCGWRRGSYHADIRGQVTKVTVKCPCDCTVVCLGCGLIDVEHWLGPWYYSEGYGRAMHKMYMVPAGHRCPDGSRSPGQRHLHPWESAPEPF